MENWGNVVLSKEKIWSLCVNTTDIATKAKPDEEKLDCCKGDSKSEKGTENLLTFVYRNKQYKGTEMAWSNIIPSSLMFPYTVWLLWFILWSLKQDQNLIYM